MDADKTLRATQQRQNAFLNTKFHLVRHITELNTPAEGSDLEDVEHKDPFILQEDVAAQVAYLRKLKFQYLEQNAKDRYTKSIVSDIDDAPIVTEEDNRQLQAINDERKAKLRLAKERLAEVQNNIRTLAPLVEEDYQKVKKYTDRASELAKKIIDARLALSRLRQAYPPPRLTIETAEQRLTSQVEEMQTLTDQLTTVQEDVKQQKNVMQQSTSDLENLRMQRVEAEKTLQERKEDTTDEARIVPLYDWITTSLRLLRAQFDLEEFHAETENELRLKHRIDVSNSESRYITIILIFQPNSRRLASVEVKGLQELGIDMGDTIDAHIQANDVHGVVAAILARVRHTRASL